MFRAETKFTSNKTAVDKAVKKGKFETLQHAVASMRRDAIKSIKQRKNKDTASPEGTPIFQHNRGLKQIGLQFFVDPGGMFAIMGWVASKFGTLGETHEKGLTEEGRDYPERPVIGPALERGIVRFQQDWRASIGT